MMFAGITGSRVRSHFESLLFIREIFSERSFHPRHWISLSYILFFLYLILIVWTFLDYGITYDEDWHSRYGEYIIQWYSSGFQNNSALTYWTLPLQGGFFSVAKGLVTRISPVGVFETGHFVNAICGLVGVWGTYRLGMYLAGPFAGFLATLFLIVTPAYYGHAFNNPIDIPMATLSVFSIYYIVRLVDVLPNAPKGLLVKLGIVIGLALAVRVGAILLILYVGIGLCLWLADRYLLKMEGVQKKIDVRATLFKVAGVFATVCIIAYLVMLAWWPAAQLRPIVQPLKGLWYATHFGYSMDVFYDGKLISNTELPWHYISKWFVITLPEFYFISLAVGLVLGGISIVNHRIRLRHHINNHALGLMIVLLSIFLPIVYTVITSPVEYDGIRHYLFIIPPLAIVAAISVSTLLERYTSSFIKATIVIAIGVSVVLTMIDMVQLHPHQYIFFNRFFGGGVAEAAKSYETDYWGNSYKEGVEWIVMNYKGPDNGRRIKVASCSYALSTSYFLPKDRFEYVGSYNDGHPISVPPDVLLATTRWNCHKKLNGNVIHTVDRLGVPLLYIIEVLEHSPQEKEGG